MRFASYTSEKSGTNGKKNVEENPQKLDTAAEKMHPYVVNNKYKIK